MTRSRRKPNKKGRGGHSRFVMLHEWFMQTEAWRALTPIARALYLELKRRYTGSNNGKIKLSHREAAVALGVSKNTVGRPFKQLVDLGFLFEEQGAFLGPSGKGETCHWRLTEEPHNNQPPTREFARWRPDPTPAKKKPRTKSRDTTSQELGQFLSSAPSEPEEKAEVSQNLGRFVPEHVP